MKRRISVRATWARRGVVGLLAALGGLVGLTAQSAVADPVAQITEFSSLGALNVPFGIAPGADGNLWFTAGNAIGRINPSGQIKLFPLGLSGSTTAGIATGPDGNLWFTIEGATNAIGRIDPATGQISEFSKGLGPHSSLIGIAPGADGNVWFTDAAGAIGRITPTGTITEFTSGLASGSDVFGIAAGPDGDLWFTVEAPTPAIGRINPASGQIKEFSVGLKAGGTPHEIAAGPDGNVWFTDETAPAIGEINPATGQISEFTSGLNASAIPEGIAAGTNGNVWFTQDLTTGGLIGEINPASDQISEFSVGLPADSNPNMIVPGADGNLWFTDFGSPRTIGKVGMGVHAAVAARPVMSGSGRAGESLTCRQGSFSNWAGVAPLASVFSFDGFRWLRDGTAIPGQTGQSYVPSSVDVGRQLACSVTVTYPVPFLVTAPASSAPVTVQPAFSVSPSPPPSAPPRPPAPSPRGTQGRRPVLSGLRVSPRRFSLIGRSVSHGCVKQTAKNRRRPACVRRIRLTIRYKLSKAATVTFGITGRIAGRKVGGRCVKQTRKNSHHRACTHRIKVPGSIARASKAGANHLLLSGTLAPGTYTLTATPRGGAARHTTFKIVG